MGCGIHQSARIKTTHWDDKNKKQPLSKAWFQPRVGNVKGEDLGRRSVFLGGHKAIGGKDRQKWGHGPSSNLAVGRGESQ